MKPHPMKPSTVAIVILSVFAALLVAAAARADDPKSTTLVWDPNADADKVLEYVVAYRPKSSATNVTAWSEVIVRTTSASIPASPFGTEFRICASNSVGRGPWTETLWLPSSVQGLKLVLPLTP